MTGFNVGFIVSEQSDSATDYTIRFFKNYLFTLKTIKLMQFFSNPDYFD